MIFGYARVSTSDQSLNLQIDALLQEGIDRKNIYTDKISSTAKERKSLNKLWDFAREGDTIVVWKLDRLAQEPDPFHQTDERTRGKGRQVQEHYRTFHRHHQGILPLQILGQYVRGPGTIGTRYHHGTHQGRAGIRTNPG